MYHKLSNLNPNFTSEHGFYSEYESTSIGAQV